jgi:hypothetical protein
MFSVSQLYRVQSKSIRSSGSYYLRMDWYKIGYNPNKHLLIFIFKMDLKISII